MARRLSALFALASGVAGRVASAGEDAVTPVEKVIELLENLKLEVENEGQAEASTYDTFACWCKDSTMSKSDAITGGRDYINRLSAEIQEKTALKEEKASELQKRKSDHEAWTAELADTEARHQKATAEYEAKAADLSKAISSLHSAIQAMEQSKPASAALVQTVESSLKIARALNIISESRRQAVSGLLQIGAKVDPSDPTYAYHSQGIIETLDKLLVEFQDEKNELDVEWGKTKETYETTVKSLQDKLDANQVAMDDLSSDIETLKSEVAMARGDLVNAEATLKDDLLYMKDMTTRCESRAQDWDQRSKMRADELEALSGALAVLKGKVVDRDVRANQRAFLQQRQQQDLIAHYFPDDVADLAPIAPHDHGMAASLLQVASKSGGAGAVAALRGAHATALSTQARQEKIALLLGKEGRRLSSTALAALAMQVSEGPFDKVKTLIQKLIERLLSEATSEATKKGFCDEELGKANKDRDFRHADTVKLDVELKGLNLKKEELEGEIELLTNEIGKLRTDLNTTTAERKVEREENLETIKTAKEGLAAVKEAITILKVFYSRAARAQAFAQFSPIDEEAASDAGFSGAYKGKQESSKGVIGMLEVIASDFDRSQRHTDEAEAKAHADFVEFDRAARADISGKETKRTLDEEDLKTTTNSIASTMEDLQTQQNLLDSALARVEELKPMCIDTGMSYEDRVARREEEIAALKRALCILDTNLVEAECQQR